MDSIISFILNFIITYSLLKFLLSLYEARMQQKEEEGLFAEQVEEMRKNLVTIEKVHQSGKDFWLIYTHEDDPKFLAQGYSEQEAIDNLTKLYPKREFFQVHEQFVRD